MAPYGGVVNKDYLKALEKQVAGLTAEQKYKTAQLNNLDWDLTNVRKSIDDGTQHYARLQREIEETRKVARDLHKLVEEAKSKV